MEESQHALRPRQIGDDVVDGALLRGRQRVGQGGNDASARPPRRCRAAAAPPALVGAKQSERKLSGQQFVIGKP